MKTVYQANDGSIHETASDAIRHENSLVDKTTSVINRIRETYWYLNKKDKDTDVGIWEVLGEDPNCDYGGSHHQPKLGYVQGTLQKAIEYAAKHPGYFTWGGGGSILKVNVQKL